MKRPTNSSYTFSCTRKRVGAMQTWPALRNLLAARTLVATSRLASSKMIAGACPPSSIVTRFMCSPAIAARCLPTAVDPVKLILRTTGCGMR